MAERIKQVSISKQNTTKKKTSVAKEIKKKATTKRTKKDFPNKPRTELNEQELKFIDAYLETANKVQSVYKAGYRASSDASASSIGTRLLKRVLVRDEINHRREKMTDKSVADAKEVMEYFSSVMRGEVRDQFGLEAPLSERTRAAQELAKRTVDLDNKIKGAEKGDKVVSIKLDWSRGNIEVSQE